ncbi:MAG: uracil-DNA glycosylase [Beutenbergiaceae bacterium]
MAMLLHPASGSPFTSPVSPGTGWPDDPADSGAPVAEAAAQVDELAGSATLSELAARVSVCRACPRLVAWREQVAVQKRRAFADQPYWGRPVPGFGDAHPQLLIVGLAPAAHGANRTGRMFTGDRSGDWLYAALHRTGYANQTGSRAAGDGLELTGARITAPVHCAPPQNKPTPAEQATCSPWLLRELDLVTPSLTAIVPLGGIGWQATFTALRQLGWRVPAPRARFGHGEQVEVGVPDGRTVTVIGSYHVSQQNTFTGRLTTQMLDEVLLRARATAEGQ